HETGMPVEHEWLARAIGVPDPHRLVPGSQGEAAAVGAKRHVEDWIVMPFQHGACYALVYDLLGRCGPPGRRLAPPDLTQEGKLGGGSIHLLPGRREPRSIPRMEDGLLGSLPGRFGSLLGLLRGLLGEALLPCEVRRRHGSPGEHRDDPADEAPPYA